MKINRARFRPAFFSISIGNRGVVYPSIINCFILCCIVEVYIQSFKQTIFRSDQRLYFGLTNVTNHIGYDLFNKTIADFLISDIEYDWKDCIYCPKIEHTPFSFTHSTKNDLLCFVSFHRWHNRSKVTLQNIRDFGCRAKILLIFDDEGYKAFQETGFEEQMLKCGIMGLNAHVKIRKIDGRLHRSSLYIEKIAILGRVLCQYQHLVDRYMSFDLTDFLFQADPFVMIHHKQEAEMILENKLVAHDYETRDQFSAFLHGDIVKYGNLSLVTGSVVYGDPFECVRVFDFVNYYFVTHPSYPPILVDQGVFTHMYYMQTYKYINLKLRVNHFYQGYIATDSELIYGDTFGKMVFYNTTYRTLAIHHPQWRCGPCENYYRQCVPNYQAY